ncbi:MAG: hypothetical protein ABJA86_03965 [Nocardioidaceae bacterium]
MPKKPFDTSEQPPGGRAAERLREFEQARGIAADDTEDTDQGDDGSPAADPDVDDFEELAPGGKGEPTPPGSRGTEWVNDDTEDD